MEKLTVYSELMGTLDSYDDICFYNNKIKNSLVYDIIGFYHGYRDFSEDHFNFNVEMNEDWINEQDESKIYIGQNIINNIDKFTKTLFYNQIYHICESIKLSDSDINKLISHINEPVSDDILNDLRNIKITEEISNDKYAAFKKTSLFNELSITPPLQYFLKDELQIPAIHLEEKQLENIAIIVNIKPLSEMPNLRDYCDEEDEVNDYHTYIYDHYRDLE